MYFGVFSIVMIVGLLTMIFGLEWVEQGAGVPEVAVRSIALFAGAFAVTAALILATPMVGRDYKLMIKDVVQRRGLARTIFFGDR